MPIYRLDSDNYSFPHPSFANEDGILAIGGDLSPERLLTAYTYGIFPWFNPGDPILWWSPDPRFVLFPDDLKVSKSMRPYFNKKKFSVTFDQAFREVMQNCQKSFRKGQGAGSWITSGMIEAYYHLHILGYAHSVEVWKNEELVGGLYGIALGKVFFGESMFTKENNASKFGFITLVKKLQEKSYWLIDCQQETKHLESLGAKPIPRIDFLEILEKNEDEETEIGDWTAIFQP